MHRLKPVPFTLKPVAFTLKPASFTLKPIHYKTKPAPFKTGPHAARYERGRLLGLVFLLGAAAIEVVGGDHAVTHVIVWRHGVAA